MCLAGQKSGCRLPEKLKGKPKDCTPKQIKECHGSPSRHPCMNRTLDQQMSERLLREIFEEFGLPEIERE